MNYLRGSVLCLIIIISLTKAQHISEAEQIALESSGALQYPPALAQKIQKDLQAIRNKFPVVADVRHTPKWQPGKLLVFDVNQEKLQAISSSPYGPTQSQAIFQDSIFSVTFNKPYHPQRLAEILRKEFGVSGEPDGIIGGSSSVTYSSDGAGKNTYVFMRGEGDCPAGCINKRFWTFTVGPEENCVELVEERSN